MQLNLGPQTTSRWNKIQTELQHDRRQIKRGCAMLKEGAPGFCNEYR